MCKTYLNGKFVSVLSNVFLLFAILSRWLKATKSKWCIRNYFYFIFLHKIFLWFTWSRICHMRICKTDCFLFYSSPPFFIHFYASHKKIGCGWVCAKRSIQSLSIETSFFFVLFDVCLLHGSRRYCFIANETDRSKRLIKSKYSRLWAHISFWQNWLSNATLRTSQ